MNAMSTVSVALLVSASASFAGPAAAVTYRCDGNLVTDSPTGGKNCVAIGSRLKSSTFSAGAVEATIDAEPTGAGPATADRESAAPRRRVSATGDVVPAASRKP